MRRLSILPLVLGSAHLLAQDPPAALPGSVTGATRTVPIVPAAATTPALNPPPIARYSNLQSYPPETVGCVFGMRTGAEWLSRMQQGHGRFLAGLNPALKLPVEADPDYRQALAAWALCQAARFTGDEKLAAGATQGVLALMTLTKDEGEQRVPICQGRTAFAAALALAAFELPADVQRTADGVKLCRFLAKQFAADGQCQLDADDPAAVTPGLALQALAACNRRAAEPAVAAALSRGLVHARAALKAKPNPFTAGAVIPAAVAAFHQTKDRDAAATALEMADWLVASQLGRQDARTLLWVGGFKADTDPGFETAFPARGLAAATHLARDLADVGRYAKYRAAAVDSLGFVRGLQYTADNTDHFEGKFRAHYLIGGVRLAPADGTVRIDATAAAVLAAVRFLESGADGRE